MSEATPVTFVEDRIPFAGIEQAIAEMIELYGGELKEAREHARTFTLPLRRGVAAGGSVECTLTWTADDEKNATLTMTCDRAVDAPKGQRILLLVAGVAGSLAFLLWPFFPGQKQFGTLAWLGGAVAVAVFLMTLRRTSGGIAYDFLQRLAQRQREPSNGVTADR